MANLKDTMDAQETKLISTGASRDMAEQERQHLEAKCQKLRFACGGESSSTLHCLCCVVISGPKLAVSF